MRLALRGSLLALMGMSLLLTPFDCFGITGLTRQAADCCAKHNCLPNDDSDDCCKRMVPNAGDFVTTSGNTLVHVLSPVEADAVEQCILPLVSDGEAARFELAYSPPSSRLLLPLLI